MTEKLKGKWKVSSLLHGELINVPGGAFLRITGETCGLEIQVFKAKDGIGDSIRIWTNAGDGNEVFAQPLADIVSNVSPSGIISIDLKFHGLLKGERSTVTHVFPLTERKEWK